MADFQENFLQLVWKYQYFDKNQLFTTQELPIIVKKIGYQNFHEGPDFNESHLKIGVMEYFGHVEVHLKSSDWTAHTHTSDDRYNSVILHVVWEHDEEIIRRDGTVIPTLELKGKVFLDVVRNYERLISGNKEILCSEDLDQIRDILKFSMLEKALVERCMEKSLLVKEILDKTMGDWEETTYRWLFYSFGFKVNNAVMLKLATDLPYRILKRHAGQPLIQEAMIMGMGGFLMSEPLDDYTQFMKKEYHYQQKKYGLKTSIHPTEWKFMRVRPTNYPAIRLAQLSAVLHYSPNLFSGILQISNIESFKNYFKFDISSYWQYHYHFGKETKKQINRNLSSMILNLLAINFLVPLWYAYGKFTDDITWQEKCFDLLQEIHPEDNRIVQKFRVHQWKPQNAFDSQGMLGLYHHYCQRKKCLECKIGQNILRPHMA